MEKNSLKRTFFYLGFILILLLLLRLPSIFIPVFNVDEAAFSAIGNAIIDGQVIYRDIPEHGAPLTPYFYALVFLLFGKNNMLAMHLVLILLIFLICILLYAIVNLATGKRDAGYIAALFFAIFSYTQHSADSLAFETEWLSLLFCLCGVYLLLRYCLKNNNPVYLFVSGVFFALAFFSKQLFLLDYIVSLLFYLAFAYRENKKAPAVLKALLLNLSGFFVISALVIFYFYINHSLRDFWFWFWQYNRQYYVPAVTFRGKIILTLRYFIHRTSFFGINYLLAILFFVNVAIKGLAGRQLFARRERPERELLIGWYLIFWAVVTCMGAAYSGRHFGHYYISALGPFCLIAAGTIQMLWDAADPQPATAGDGLKLNTRMLRIFLVLVVLQGIFSPLHMFSGRLMKWQGFGQKNAREFYFPNPIYELGEYIKANSDKQDKVFVWGFYPEVYLFADRRPATRYTNCNYLTGLIPWTNWEPDVDTSRNIVPGAWEKCMEELKRSKPKFIIDTSFGDVNFYGKYPLKKFAPLYAFMKENYKIKRLFSRENGDRYVGLWERTDNR